LGLGLGPTPTPTPIKPFKLKFNNKFRFN